MGIKINDMTQSLNNIATPRESDFGLHNDHTSNVFDKINKRLTLIRESEQKRKAVPSDHFFGYVLYANPITLGEFKQKFPQDTTFYKEVLLAGGASSSGPKVKASNSATIMECTVHIPEITGFLPLPDTGKIFAALALPDSAPASYKDEYAIRKKQFDKIHPKLRKESFSEIMKINLYPKFYFYTEESKFPSMEQFCEIKYSKSLPEGSRGVGIFLRQLSGKLRDTD